MKYGKRKTKKRVPQLTTKRVGIRGEKRKAIMPTKAKESDVAEAGHMVFGKKASDIEWATYKALLSLGWKSFGFQVSVFGGRRIKGGQVLDFVLRRPSGETIVVDVRGEYFHGNTAANKAADRARELQLLAGSSTPRLVIIWEREAHNWQRLRAKLLQEVGAF